MGRKTQGIRQMRRLPTEGDRDKGPRQLPSRHCSNLLFKVKVSNLPRTDVERPRGDCLVFVHRSQYSADRRGDINFGSG